MKELNKVGFFRSSLLIKFLESRLEVFKVRGLVFHLFLLKLRVTLDSALERIHKSSGVTKILSKKSFKINSG